MLKKFSVKFLGIICTLAVLVSAVFVPVNLLANAAAIPVEDDKTVVFSFEESEGSVTGQDDANNLTRGDDGMGCASWGLSLRTEDGNTAMGYKHTNPVNWADSGGYRLNNNDGVYMLDTETTYIVSFKFKMKSVPVNTASLTNPKINYLNLGYGFKGATSNNTVSAMQVVVSEVFSADSVMETDKSKATYTLTDAGGKTTQTVGDTWHELTYVFTTPETFGDYSAALGFFSSNNYGVHYLVDDVKVTKLGSDNGAVVMIDEYYGTAKVAAGKQGEAVELETLTGKDPSHEFLGWYKDTARTQKVDGITFAKETQTVYTAWKAPVTVTFTDGLNNKTYQSTGVAGESINYPADPKDTVNNPEQYWFMGWYTTESYTEEFTNTAFGYSDITVYAKWQGEIADQVQDFENYTSDKRGVETDSNGYKKYNNRFVFGAAMIKVEDPTENNKGFVAGINWDGEMVAVKDNPATYDASARYASAKDNVIYMQNIALLQDVTYNVTFDYYVENISPSQGVSVYPYSATAGSVWATGISYKSTQGVDCLITAADKDGQWHKGEFTFTANYLDAKSNAIYMLMQLSENSDTVIYVDNFTFSAVQPYQATVTYKCNNNKADVVYIGERGEVLPSFTPENSGLVFLGWYADEECTIPFTKTVYGRNPLVAYAKWGGQVIEFNDYSYTGNALAFSQRSLSIDKSVGAGLEDNFALRWHYDGDGIYSESDGKITYRCERNTRSDNSAMLKKLENNTTYEISYYCLVESANTDFNVQFATSWAGNIWEPGCCKYYTESNTVLRVSDVGKGWIKKSCILTTDFNFAQSGAAADTLYISLSAFDQKMESDIKAKIDRIVIAEVTDDIIIFSSGNELAEGSYQIGKAGDRIVVPTLNDGVSDSLGFFVDETLDVPFTDTTLKEGITYVYAKWPALPIKFDNYKYAFNDKYRFGSRMKILNQKGIGADGDDYVLNFELIGDEVRQVDANGKVSYWRERAGSSSDHILQLGNVTDKTVYKVTYYYRAVDGLNCDVVIDFATGNGSNIWTTGTLSSYVHTGTVVSPGNTEWKKAEVVFATNLAAPNGNTLYMRMATTASTDTLGMVLRVQVDNILVSKIDAPYVYFDGQNESYVKLVNGEVGQAITMPEKPQKVGYNFAGWYLDTEFTVPFTATHFAAGDKYVAYAKYSRADYVLYDFENYNLSNPPGYYVWGNYGCVTKQGKAYSGKGSVELNRTTENEKYYYATYAAVGHNKEAFEIEPDRKYIVKFKYYVAKAPVKDAKLAFTSGHKTSYHHQSSDVTTILTIPFTEKTGVWNTAVLVIDGSKMKDPTCNTLFVRILSGNDGLYYIDNIEITRLPKGYTAYTVDNGDCKAVPQYISGPIGSSFANKLPKEPKLENHHFKGYTYYDANNNESDLLEEKMVFSNDTMRIVANFVRINTLQDFEKGYTELLDVYGDYGTLDFDWELYDAEAEGNLAENVTSGKYSLHRKGESQYFENAQVLTQDKTLTMNERYTVTMKVKVGKHFHTDGAIKIVSNNNAYYPWATEGSYRAVAAIADIADGNWHEITFTFVAVAPYISIQTPGYVELFIDDIVINRVDSGVSTSADVTFTEYVPARRDAAGNLINEPVWNADVFKLVEGNGANKILSVILIAGGAIIVLAAAVILLIVIKKRKSKKA